MRIAISLLLAAILTVPTPALAGNKGKKAHNAPAEQIHMSPATASLITVTERTIIFNYVNQYRDTLVAAPGGAQSLPPGVAKKLARGGTLPPGIAKRYLPQDLLVQLPPRPGYQWVVVDNDVVLIAAATGLIVDVLADLL
jgi:hypothetical protein